MSQDEIKDESPARGIGKLDIMMVGTSDAANGGAVCRAMKNFGAGNLYFVAPRCEDPKGGRAQALACGATDYLEESAIHPTMEEAQAQGDIDFLAAFSARVSSIRGPFFTPEQFGQKCAEAFSRGKRVALVLGREDRGLATDEIVKCHWKVHIPTTGFSSLNVAQAGVVGMYAVYRAQFDEPELELKEIKTVSDAKKSAAHTPVDPRELEKLMEMFHELFHKINFGWEDNPLKVLVPFRQLFQRGEMTQREARLMMSFIRRNMVALGDRNMTREARLRKAAKDEKNKPKNKSAS
jgi:TrmH family RNA methyltransferase